MTLRRTILSLAAAALIAGCESNGPDTIAYRVVLYRCSQGCAIQNQVDTAYLLDTIAVHILLDAAIPETPVPVTIRGYCAENAVAYLDQTQVRTFPPFYACPDSVDRVVLTNTTRVDRWFLWIITTSAPRGTYRIEGRLLISPPGTATRTFTVRPSLAR